MPSPLHSRNWLAYVADSAIRGYRGRVANGKRTWDEAIAIVAPQLYADEVPTVLQMIADKLRREAERNDRARLGKIQSKGAKRHIRRKQEPFT